MKRFLLISMLMLAGVSALAQPDKRDVRQGNRSFAKGRWSAADISYRKALMADSTSVAANYNLASVQYRQEDYQGAAKSLERIKGSAPLTPHGADYFYNVGDVALQAKDYKTAVEAFMQSLLRNPGDLDAKENYIYAKKMLENQQQGGDGQNDQDQNQDQQNQDQNQQNQDQNQQNQDQNQDQKDQNQDQQNQNQDQDRQDQEQQPQEARGELSPQQAQQILQAMQDQEKQTQDKVKKEKAAALKSRQKDKNW